MEELKQHSTEHDGPGLRPAEYELTARWYRFFCNQGFEAEILTGKSSAIIRLNGDSPLVIVPIYNLHNKIQILEKENRILLDQNCQDLVKFLASDAGISSEADILVVGSTGLFIEYTVKDRYQDAAGYLKYLVGVMTGDDWSGAGWQMALIFTCFFCQKIGIRSAYGSYQGRPCGHHHGDHYILDFGYKELDHMANQWSWTSHVDRNFRRSGPEKYDLYRAYSENGDLLYVGQSNDWPRRMGEHKRSSSWLDYARKVTITAYASKAELDYAEKVAILTEGPLFNIVYNR